MCSNSVDSAHVVFEVNWTNIKGSCQSERKVVAPDSKSDLPLETRCTVVSLTAPHTALMVVCGGNVMNP